MLIDESRDYRSAFSRLSTANLTGLDFTCLLAGVMAIADEINSQLSQAVRCYATKPHNTGPRARFIGNRE